MERERTMRPVIQIFRLLTVNVVRIGFEGSTDYEGRLTMPNAGCEETETE